MVDRWEAVGDFVAAMDFWVGVQAHLSEVLGPEFYYGRPLPVLFESPYSNGDRLELPNGPGRAENSDGFKRIWMVDEGSWMCLRSTSRTRSGYFENISNAWCGSVEEAGKNFNQDEIAQPTRRMVNRKSEVIIWRWHDIGLAAGWEKLDEPNPNGFAGGARFYRSDNPERFYITLSNDTATSHLLNLSWREMTET